MSYRPICDVWFLARSRLHYYGAYPGGFLERARSLLGVQITDPVLHVCGGKVREYPYAGGWGVNDKTLDLDPALAPDFLQDAGDPFPEGPWGAVLIDPPYTAGDAARYAVESPSLPTPNLLLRRGLAVVPIGGRVGLLHYALPQPPRTAKFIAAIGVMTGFNNRIRVYSVFERRA